MARSESEFVGEGGICFFHRRVSGRGIARKVIVPAFDVGTHEGAEFRRVFAGEFTIGEKHGVGAEAGVPRGKEAGFGAPGFHDVVGLCDEVALLDGVFFAEEGGDRKVLGDDVDGDAVVLF